MNIFIKVQPDSDIEFNPESGHAVQFIDRNACMTEINLQSVCLHVSANPNTNIIILEMEKDEDNV